MWILLKLELLLSVLSVELILKVVIIDIVAIIRVFDQNNYILNFRGKRPNLDEDKFKGAWLTQTPPLLCACFSVHNLIDFQRN